LGANTGYSFWVLPDNKFQLRFGREFFQGTNVWPKWIPLSATYNSKYKTVSIFFNGVLDKTYTDVSDSIFNADLYIGKSKILSETRFAFNGSIDEVRIWNRALSQAEIVI
jgi:hypothetical protein